MDMLDFPPPGFEPGPSKLPGIDVYVPVTEAKQRPEVVDFKCPKCGATIAYDVSQGGLACEYCGYTEAARSEQLGQEAQPFEFKVETMRRALVGWGSERKELACQRCGGVVSVPPDTLAYSCPFCGSNKVLYREPMEDVLRPRYLIPFKLSPEECKKLTQKWLGSSWMLPGELREIAVERFNPIYIPYWTFDAVCNATWKARVAHNTTEYYIDEEGHQREHSQTNWRDEAGKVEKVFSGLLVPGTTRLYMGALAKMDGFQIQDLILYEPKYLAGMQAQAYDLSLEKAWDAGRQIMRERTRQACLDRASSTQVDAFRMTLDFKDEAWRYILVPIYTSIYQYGNKTFQILVNGQTGKIAGPRPVDWEKVWLVILAILTPGLLIGLLGWMNATSETGILVAGGGMMLFVIAAVVAFFLIQQARELEHD